MTSTTDMSRNVHHGRNIKRFREMKLMKQETLAFELGEDWTQKKISLLEAKEEVEPEILERVAKVLEVSPEAIRSFTEEAAVSYFNTFNDNSVSNVIGNYGTYNIKPVEKWMEALDENKKLYQEKIALYERMLKDKTDMIEKLEKLLLAK